MIKRLELHNLLVKLLGSTNVYFQPPSTVTMKYPCIVYSRNDLDTLYANNNPYRFIDGYLITIIDANPDSEIHLKIRTLPYCDYERRFTKDNLNHEIYTLFY